MYIQTHVHSYSLSVSTLHIAINIRTYKSAKLLWEVKINNVNIKSRLKLHRKKNIVLRNTLKSNMTDSKNLS